MNPLPLPASRSRSASYRKSFPLVVVAIADQHLCRDYATHLVDNGFAAPAVASAAEAARLATCLSPEAVVFDLDARGVYAAGHLRREPLTRHIGLVAVSPPEITGRVGPSARGLFDAVIEAPHSAVALLTELLAMLRAVRSERDLNVSEGIGDDLTAAVPSTASAHAARRLLGP